MHLFNYLIIIIVLLYCDVSINRVTMVRVTAN